jgi:hypothetical protein
VEDAFKRRLFELSRPETTELPSRDLAVTKVTKDFSRRNGAEPRGIDKSVLAVAAPRRYRNKEHLRFVAQQPCLLCARKPSDPHHFDSSNHGRWAARPATSSRFRFAAHTTGRYIALATSAHGGSRPASIDENRPQATPLADALSAPSCGVNYFELKIPRG